MLSTKKLSLWRGIAKFTSHELCKKKRRGKGRDRHERNKRIVSVERKGSEKIFLKREREWSCSKRMPTKLRH